MSASSALSRRVSEFVGVLSFAVALLWLIALATYNPADPAWFFSTGATQPATNLAGRAGAFVAELSLQTLGYAAYLFPVLAAIVGWYRFWCAPIDALYTKLVGVVLLLSSTASFLSLALAAARETGVVVRARRVDRRSAGGRAGGVVQPDRVAHHHPHGARPQPRADDAVLVRQGVRCDLGLAAGAGVGARRRVLELARGTAPATASAARSCRSTPGGPPRRRTPAKAAKPQAATVGRSRPGPPAPVGSAGAARPGRGPRRLRRRLPAAARAG